MRTAPRTQRILLLLVLLVALFSGPAARAQTDIIWSACNFGEYVFLCGADPDSPGDHVATYGPFFAPIFDISVAENGRLAAYRTYSNDSLYVANVDGTGARGVYDPEGYVTALALSPDGSRLAYRGDGTSSLYVVDLESGERTEAQEHIPGWFWSNSGFPVWSPDGTRLLFDVYDNPTSSLALYLVNADGSGTPQQVTFPVGTAFSVLDHSADWSRDGNRIAIVRQTMTSSTESTHQILLLDIETAAPPQVLFETASVSGSGGGIIPGLQWSPDGSELAFIREEGDYPYQYVLYTIPATGGALKRINSTNQGSEYWYSNLIQWAAPPVEDLVVNDTRDLDDFDTGDGVCDAHVEAGEQCTLRAAIQEANVRPGRDRIAFDLSGNGPFLITTESQLPAITEAVELDGSTQPGTGDLPLIRIDGSQAGDGTSGLVVQSDDVTIRGLIVTGFGGHGIHVKSGNDGVLEGLIVGTDAAGTEGLGNGGDGIHLSGGERWRVGGEEKETSGKTTDLSRLVTLAGNHASGFYAFDPVRAAQVRARVEGGGAAPQPTNLTLAGLVVGMVDAATGPIALPNGGHGISLEGVVNATLDRLRVSDAVEHAVRVSASESIDIRRAVMGLRNPALASDAHVGSIGGSIFRIVESLGVTLGSDDAADAPVQGGGAKGWFVELENARNVQVRNLLGGVTSNIGGVSENVRQALRNLSGGMSIMDSPEVTVGAAGLPTVFANNGGDDSKPQAGLFATGSLTRKLRAVNLFLGTNREAMKGIGNLGNGLVLTDGVREAVLGGESEEEWIVSAGNGGFGYLFKNLSAAAGVPPAEDIGGVVTANRLVSDFVKTASGELVHISNEATAFRLDEVEAIRMAQLTIGPALQNGVEIINSAFIEFESARIGAYWEGLVEELDDIAGPAGDGIVIEESEDIAIGRRLYEDYVTTGYQVHVIGAGGRALFAHKAARMRLANWASGLTVEGSDESEAIFDALGSGLEAILIEESEDVDIENAAFMSNGEHATSGGGGLLINGSRSVRVLSTIFGELTREREARRQNHHAALKALNSTDVQVKLSQIVGHAQGVVAENSEVSLQDNLLRLQGAAGGEGDAVQATGQSILTGARNVVTDNTGAGFWFDGGAEGLIRHNDIEGNGQGVVVEGGGGKRGTQAAASRVQAPDNWWGDASGPGGAGPGSGDAISEGVEAATWLMSPLGVIVSPETHVVEAWAVSDVSVPVTYSSPRIGEDVLDVTVTDERGWVTSASSFEVSVPASGWTTEVLEASLRQAGANRVTIRAVSRADNSLVGEAEIVISSPKHVVPLENDAEAGATILEARADEAFIVGGEVTINPGGANEERVTIAGFGSILLAEPLQFSHRAGERVVPTNMLAVGVEQNSAVITPTAATLTIYPNPADSEAQLILNLPESGSTVVEVFDMIGRRIRVLKDGTLASGTHSWSLALDELPSGMYLARARMENGVVTRAFVVAR